jgi:small subunit ribosomal protein S2
LASEFVRELIDSGIHFGHRVSRWNPKMAPYIHGKRNLIHIIDIRETVKGLLRAKKFLGTVVSGGQDVLFVGTKRQAKHSVISHADGVSMPYVSERWLGGTLTNFRTIRSRLNRLEELEGLLDAEDASKKFSKKRMSILARERMKIDRNLRGIRKMDRLPGAMVVIDCKKEYNAIHEARKLKIPTICLVDTDSNPDWADIAIPGNDDAIRSIDVVLNHLVEAVKAGVKGRVVQSEPPTEDEGPRRKGRRMTTTQMAESMAAESGIESATKEGAPADRPVATEAPAAVEANAAAEPKAEAVEAPQTDAPVSSPAEATEQPAG